MSTLPKNGLRVLNLLGPFLFVWVVSEKSHVHVEKRRMFVRRKGDLMMRTLLTFAIIATMAAVGLGGCFWHHQQAVQTQPLK